MQFTSLLAVAIAIGIAIPAQAQISKGDVLIRARAIVVAPNERSGAVTPGFPGSHLGVDSSVAPEVDFTYMLSDHIGTELILATTKHSVSGRGTIAALDKVASTWVLPPTLTLQYHFAPKSHVRPYLGAGVNYTIFYHARASDSLVGAIGATDVHLTDSFGYALQTGIDVDISRRMFVNLDVKYIDINTTARLDTGAAVNRARVHVDPIVAGIGVGIRL
ncbi:OmpW family outer membrane protein [Sphingomonas sp. TREG-RG-20F-R18-01]|uniref:OmpW/AlkL family protein n=1 Tax=Sphingomonas sp. TREG-RG-20F-R18-01 TaxID=2914982 RepID=UPI001F56DF6E|nr:OmpW family outer membrane protein [Sphingomonas sp. TREG-RG-20F-R18-01]